MLKKSSNFKKDDCMICCKICNEHLTTSSNYVSSNYGSFVFCGLCKIFIYSKGYVRFFGAEKFFSEKEFKKYLDLKGFW